MRDSIHFYEAKYMYLAKMSTRTLVWIEESIQTSTVVSSQKPSNGNCDAVRHIIPKLGPFSVKTAAPFHRSTCVHLVLPSHCFRQTWACAQGVETKHHPYAFPELPPDKYDA